MRYISEKEELVEVTPTINVDIPATSIKILKNSLSDVTPISYFNREIIGYGFRVQDPDPKKAYKVYPVMFRPNSFGTVWDICFYNDESQDFVIDVWPILR
ncbi:hypothetical protein [Clostridium sp. UBA5119]|uniref:hypothetical protein n=1 Tax=Clostridium sp. UBA5119 TaxID=1946366 RepID=UPI003217731B